MPELRFKTLHGDEVLPHLTDLAELRIGVFREYPYLYEGNLDYEARYLRVYAESPRSVFVLALDGGRVVGVSTGVPLREAGGAFQQPFLNLGYDPARWFYFGESVLLKPYRGQGAGVRFFQERESYALSLGNFDQCCFCAIERPADHPRRPPDYQPLDEFWRKRGYRKHPELRATFRWKELGEAHETPKPMVFWLKALLGWPARTGA